MSFEKIDKNNIPHHVAVIMDGNGRWAKKRGMKREHGHRAGRKSSFLYFLINYSFELYQVYYRIL